MDDNAVEKLVIFLDGCVDKNIGQDVENIAKAY